jgi:addiction module HigA family antidote
VSSILDEKMAELTPERRAKVEEQAAELIREEAWMKSPPHPGGIVRRQCLDPLGLSVDAAATKLGVPALELQAVLDGQLGITPVMADALENAGWGTASLWIGLQQDYDAPRLAAARRRMDAP